MNETDKYILKQLEKIIGWSFGYVNTGKYSHEQAKIETIKAFKDLPMWIRERIKKEDESSFNQSLYSKKSLIENCDKLSKRFPEEAITIKEFIMGLK